MPGGRLGTVRTQGERRNDTDINLPRKSRPTLGTAGDLEGAAAKLPCRPYGSAPGHVNQGVGTNMSVSGIGPAALVKPPGRCV